MPQIKEYTAENDVLRPTETGIEAYGQAARRINAFYGQAGEALRRSAEDRARAAQSRATAAGALATEERAKATAYTGVVNAGGNAIEAAQTFETHREVSPAVASFAEASNGMMQQWKDLVSQQAGTDPNNSSIRAGFLQNKFEPWAANFVKNFNTPGAQDWATEQVNHLRNHLVETTAADTATMQGIATNYNLDRTGAAHANTARNDPSSLGHLIGDPGKNNGQIDRDVEATVSTTGLTGIPAFKARTEAATKMKQDALRAGALGGIEQSSNPEAFAKNFNNRWQGVYDDPMLANQIEAAGKSQARANQLDDERTDRIQKRQAEDTSKKRLDDFVKDDADPYPKLKLNDAQKDQKLLVGDREKAIKMIRRGERPETDASISRQSSLEIMADIRRGKATDDDIMDRYIQGDLTKADRDDLRKELSDRKTPEGQALAADRDLFMKRVGTRVDPEQGGNLYLFEMGLRQRQTDLKAKGIDPREATDPNSSNYFGDEKNIQKYKVPYQQQLQNIQQQREEQTKAVKFKQSAPESLQKIPGLEANKDWTRFRDPATKKVYDTKGNEIGGAVPAASVPVR